jgi:hypothetical protein
LHVHCRLREDLPTPHTPLTTLGIRVACIQDEATQDKNQGIRPRTGIPVRVRRKAAQHDTLNQTRTITARPPTHPVSDGPLQLGQFESSREADESAPMSPPSAFRQRRGTVTLSVSQIDPKLLQSPSPSVSPSPVRRRHDPVIVSSESPSPEPPPPPSPPRPRIPPPAQRKSPIGATPRLPRLHTPAVKTRQAKREGKAPMRVEPQPEPRGGSVGSNTGQNRPSLFERGISRLEQRSMTRMPSEL